MPEITDISGQQFGRLTVIRIAHRNKGGIYSWHCICTGGNKRIARGSNLKNGTTKSCGCLFNEGNNVKHEHARGGKRSPTLTSWDGMFTRCYNTAAKSYKNYGGRGIRVCKRWHRFENFLTDMGERPPNRSLDRINNNGRYAPGNCRWATATEQVNNRRVSRHG